MEELINSWDRILQIFKEEYDIQDISFNTFIKPLKIYSVDDNVITLLVSKGRMGVSLIEKKYREFLEITVCEVMDDKYTIRLISDEDLEHEEKIKKEKIKKMSLRKIITILTIFPLILILIIHSTHLSLVTITALHMQPL